MRFIILLFISIIVLAQHKVLLHVDFKGIADTQDATNVLKSKGFEFRLDKEKFHFFIQNEVLYIETNEPAAVLFGQVLRPKKLDKPLYAVIEWGVDTFPKGADWDSGNNRLPIGLIMVFGNKKLPSGIGFLAPKVPTFLCPFIGEKEKIDKRYFGKLYKKGGRYFCVSNEQHLLIRTSFDIKKHYFEEFEKTPPPLTAFAFQVNTKSTEGRSKSFIKSFTLYGEN